MEPNSVKLFDYVSRTNREFIVFRCGKIYSTIVKRFLTLTEHTYGYARCTYNAREKQITILLHRALAEAFIPNPENKRCVNHLDGNKRNSVIENLEWATHSENLKHSYDVLGRRAPGTIHKGPNHYYNNPLKMIDDNGDTIRTFYGFGEANKHHYWNKYIKRSIKNKCKYKDYYWQLA